MDGEGVGRKPTGEGQEGELLVNNWFSEETQGALRGLVERLGKPSSPRPSSPVPSLPTTPGEEGEKQEGNP